MKKIVNLTLCVLFAAAAVFCLFPLLDGEGTFWHGALCVIFACSSIAFSSTLCKKDQYKKIS